MTSFSVSPYPDSNELFVKNNPGEEIDEGDVGREEGHDLGAALK